MWLDTRAASRPPRAPTVRALNLLCRLSTATSHSLQRGFSTIRCPCPWTESKLRSCSALAPAFGRRSPRYPLGPGRSRRSQANAGSDRATADRDGRCRVIAAPRQPSDPVQKYRLAKAWPETASRLAPRTGLISFRHKWQCELTVTSHDDAAVCWPDDVKHANCCDRGDRCDGCRAHRVARLQPGEANRLTGRVDSGRVTPAELRPRAPPASTTLEWIKRTVLWRSSWPSRQRPEGWSGTLCPRRFRLPDFCFGKAVSGAHLWSLHSRASAK